MDRRAGGAPRHRAGARAGNAPHREAGLVGITELSDWPVRDRRAVVGTWFARRWWGSGLNAEAKRLVALLAFDFCGLERFGASPTLRSHAALAKAGFSREGVLRAFHRHGEQPKDVAVFSLLRGEASALAGRRRHRPDDGSRMTGDCHVRF